MAETFHPSYPRSGSLSTVTDLSTKTDRMGLPVLQLRTNVWHMSSGGFRSESLSTEAENTIKVLRLATHKPRHYLYAVLYTVFISSVLEVSL